MKRIFGFLALATLVTLTACNGNSNKGSTVGYTHPPGTNGTAYNSSSGWGYVSGTNLQSAIASMFGSNGSQIGNIASTPDGQTGVFFNGSVQSSAGVLTSGSATATGGTLNFQVWDSYVGQTDSSGQQTPPIIVGMTLASAQISPQNTQLIFQDSQGQLIFAGQFNQATFQGTLTYSGSNGQIALGSFSIATCSFLRCQ